MTEKTSLSLESQAMVRKYMLKLVTIPTAVLVLGSFVFGFFVNDIATGSAYQNAYSSAFSDVIRTVTSTASNASMSALEAQNSKEIAQSMQQDLSGIYEEIKTSELLMSTDKQIQEISKNLLTRNDFIDRVNSMKEFKGFDRGVKPVRIEVNGGAGWGSWREASYCPANYYVCGLSQRVEGNQGRGDDTALNSVALECCPLFGEALQARDAGQVGTAE